MRLHCVTVIICAAYCLKVYEAFCLLVHTVIYDQTVGVSEYEPAAIEIIELRRIHFILAVI